MKTFKRRLISILSIPVPLLVIFLAVLPFRVIYLLASIMSFMLYRVLGYRKKVVLQNLQNAFPEKQQSEILCIVSDFYKHLGDITVEAFKVIMISPSSIRRRLQMTPEAKAIFQGFYNQKKSIILVIGHYGNWEWIGPGINLLFPNYLHTAYKPLKNTVMDWFIRKTRARFGLVLVPSDQVIRHMINLERDNQYKAFALAADQAPAPKTAYWLKFLNQDTPFFTGPEKLAKKFNQPVVFCSFRKQKRGHYQIHAEVITESPGELPPYKITTDYARLLETEIRNAPQYWLWSHKRWKHTRK